VDLDDVSFHRTLKGTKKLVIVEFYTTSCSNCKAIEPVYRELSNELSKDAIFTRIDSQMHNEVATTFGIMGVPTFKFFCRNKPIGEIVGAVNATILRNTIKDLIRHRNECVEKSTSFELDGYM